jgi:HAD superfamily hydrolase (TIGR01509 family)
MYKKLFIFDLDGVLVEACDWHRDALNEALLETCNFIISEEEHKSIFNGIPTSKKLNILSERGLVPWENHKQINDLKQEKTIEIIQRCAVTRHEKIEMISAIKDAGHVVCCYTNSIRKTASLMLRKTGIESMFDYILTNQDVSEPKPDPEGYLFIMEKFGFDKKDTFIIEDSPKGMLAAISSGGNLIKVNNADEVDINIIRSLI